MRGRLGAPVNLPPHLCSHPLPDIHFIPNKKQKTFVTSQAGEARGSPTRPGQGDELLAAEASASIASMGQLGDS